MKRAILLTLFGASCMANAQFIVNLDPSDFPRTMVRNDFGTLGGHTWLPEAGTPFYPDIRFTPKQNKRREQGPAGGDNSTVSDLVPDGVFSGGFTEGTKLGYYPFGKVLFYFDHPARVFGVGVKKLGLFLQTKGYGEFVLEIMPWSGPDGDTFTFEGVTTNNADGNVLFIGFEMSDPDRLIEGFTMKAWMKGNDPINTTPIAMSAPVYDGFEAKKVVPEPITGVVLAGGALGLMLRRRFQR